MSRFRRVLAGLTVAALVVPAAGCATTSTNGIAVSGTTRADLVTVAAPRLTAPNVDYTVGIAKLQTPALISASQKKAQAAALAAAFSRQPVAAGMLSTVTVQAGDTVKKGQVLAVFDDSALELGVQYAEAGYRRVREGANTLDATADDLRSQKSDVRSKGLAALASGQKQMNAAKATLATQYAQLSAKIASAERDKPNLRELQAQMASLQAQIQALVSSNPTMTPEVLKKIAGLKKQATEVGTRIGMVMALPQMQAGMAKMKAGQQQLAAAQAKLDSGRSQLNSGLAKMSDGILQLNNGADTMRTASGVQSAGLASAKNALAQATLRAPCDGVVISAISAGQVATVGEPIVTIRPSVGTLVDTYLTSDQLSGVKAGEKVDVTLDSVPGVLSGTVATVWPNQVFPPSNYPTKIVHMSSVTRVTIRLPDDALPRGIPCDVVIHPSQ